MRRGLQVMLGAALLASAGALWIDDAPRLVAPLERRAGFDTWAAARPQALANTAALEPLPARIEPLQVEPAKRDFFVPFAPPAAPGVSAPVLVAPPPVIAVAALPPSPPPPPIPPAAPTIAYRYLGSMTTPDGERIVLLARGETPVPVVAGTRLDEGYVVEAVSDEAVRLVYPALGSIVLVQIPQARTP